LSILLGLEFVQDLLRKINARELLYFGKQTIDVHKYNIYHTEKIILKIIRRAFFFGFNRQIFLIRYNLLKYVRSYF